MRVSLTGYNADNLIQTLYRKGITLHDVKRNDLKNISFTIQDKHFKKIKKYLVNYKYETTPLGVKRLPRILVANIGILIGCFIGLVFGLISSNYTWQILVYGTQDINSNEILEVLGDNGIKIGKVNTQTGDEIEKILIKNCDRIAQVSVVKTGTAIIINLSEKLIYEKNDEQPLMAKYCGIIKSINLISGTLNVKVGDYVNAGDVLVKPHHFDSSNEKVSVKPIAEIVAEMYITAKCELNREETKLVRTGNCLVEYKYKLKNRYLFSGKNKNSFALFEMSVYNENISSLIPLSRDVCVYYQMKEMKIENDFDQEKEKLVLKSQNLADRSCPEGEVLDKQTTSEIVGDKLFATTVITILGQIC